MYKDNKALDEIPDYDKVINDKLLKSCGADDFYKFIKEKVDTVFPKCMDMKIGEQRQWR